MAKYLVRCEKCWEDWVEAENEDEETDCEEEMGDLDIGFDPYMGCYTDDC